MATRVKICGLRNVEDALAAARAGSDAIGLVFYAPSPRNVDLATASAIVTALPPFVAAVGLFVDAPREQVLQTLAQVRLDLLQFHGDETAEYCASFGLPYMKAVRVRPGLDLLQYAFDFRSAKALLLDTYVESEAGGTGRRFDWTLVPADLPLPIVLSGGLDPDNVAEAIRQVSPWAVDVSSGVESARGVKDKDRIARFILGVRHEDLRSA